MKRFIMIMLVAAMALTMFACGKEAPSSESSLPNEPISESTPVDTIPADTQAPTGGGMMWTDFKYSFRISEINLPWCNYINERTGKTLDELWKTEWKCDDGSGFSLIEIVDELGVPREKFEEFNNNHYEAHVAIIGSSDSLMEDNVCCEVFFTDEEIDIIYSGDKRRIAEVFAFPYAVVADNWELYPLRWIIDNPATLYKEREISLDAIQKSVDKIIEDGLVKNADKEALLARIEEYKKLL